MQIKTNYHWREFSYRYEVPADILESQFDYMKVTDPDTGATGWDEDNYTDGFFQYRGLWYHLSEFMRWTCPQSDGPLDETYWQGYHAHSAFSGVLIHLSDDGEQFQLATYLS